MARQRCSDETNMTHGDSEGVHSNAEPLKCLDSAVATTLNVNRTHKERSRQKATAFSALSTLSVLSEHGPARAHRPVKGNFGGFTHFLASSVVR